MRRVVAAALAVGLALALGLALAGCGGSRPKPQAQRIPLEPLPAAPAAARHAATPPAYPAPATHPRSFAAVATGNAAALGDVAASVSPSPSRASGGAGTQPAGAGAGAQPGGAGSGAQLAGAGSGTQVAGAGSGAQFAAAADAICTSYREQVRSTAAQATTLAAQEGELQDLVGETAAVLGQLSALSSPGGDAALVARFVALTRASVGDFVLAQRRTTSGTSEAATVALEDHDLRLAQASARDALAARAAAHLLGLHVCGSPGAEWL